MARLIGGGMRLLFAQNMPDSEAVLQPTAAARSARSCNSAGRRNASPPEIASTSGWSSTVKLSTKPVNNPAGASSLVKVEFVAQCAQFSGQRRVRANDTPAAGTARITRESARGTPRTVSENCQEGN